MKDQNTEKYFQAFNAHFNGQRKHPFHKIREEAAENFNTLGFPTTKNEEWRFTNLARLAKSNFTIADSKKVSQISIEDIRPFLLKDWKGAQIVFIDGFFSKKLSKLESINNAVSVEPLSFQLDSNNKMVNNTLSKIAAYNDEAFTALNTAFTTDGSVITIPDKVVEENGIHILHIAASSQSVTNPRNIIICGKNSEAIIVESYHTLTEGDVFVNSVTEISLDENAQLHHYKYQEESQNSYHIGTTAIKQKSNSNYTSAAFDFGGKLVRNNISTKLEGNGITSTLNGLYVGTDSQHIDNHTFIDHAKAHCESHELYRGILKDKAKGVFSGKILVRQDAQKTDAKQSNNCLLLSENAQIDAKPQLEIYADDVKCTHGSTVGQLDENALFYFRARGIPKEKALSILTYAFAEEIITGVKSKALQERVEQLLLNRLARDK